ncbi:hypothetical protein [Rhodovulum strictum]|uniref:DUF4239 domain-containing protein n=1 Tax=Rhodovulum strictum TaxID=58314 RepID=A0A844BKF7_9RHOB|nr:hypothetical protein [Rhodovulum strictum]MRH22095.1 hypothetical protein [Rhodovulum strictum]
MTLTEGLENSDLTLLGLIIMAGMMLAREAGYRLGRWRARHREKPDDGLSVLVGSLLGLMSFVLAINLSTSITRFEDRRHATLNEVTAISTAWLQGRAVAESEGQQIARLLERYLAERRAFADAPQGSPEVAAAAAATSILQAAIWTEVTALLRARTDPQTVGLSAALTTTFDNTTAQVLAIETGLPRRLVWLLVIASALAISALGLYLGVLGHPRLVLSLVIVTVWSGIMVLILDVSTARIGRLNTDLRLYDWTAESFAAFPPILAAPGPR